MESFLTYVGSIASIGSVPLAIFIFLKSKEQKKDKTRQLIIKIISYRIGEQRDLDYFELEMILKSNLRNNKLNQTAINMKSILEDLISETVSSPLLDSKRKDEILENIKSIYPSQESMEDVKYTTIKLSTIFAVTTLSISLLGIVTILIVGKSGWNKDWDFFFSFNTVTGFWPNFLFSIILVIVSIMSSILLSKYLDKRQY